MIGIRFHGRGEHGVKTAGRIVSMTAFMAGHHCQDCPVYGAECRGASAAAYARIADKLILERGVIAHLSLIVLADEMFLQDPAAGILAGQQTVSAVFINTRDKQPLADGLGLHPR